MVGGAHRGLVVVERVHELLDGLAVAPVVCARTEQRGRPAVRLRWRRAHKKGDKQRRVAPSRVFAMVGAYRRGTPWWPEPWVVGCAVGCSRLPPLLVSTPSAALTAERCRLSAENRQRKWIYAYRSNQDAGWTGSRRWACCATPALGG